MLDLMSLAAWQDEPARKAGELLVGTRWLAERWRWSRERVRRFLLLLVQEGTVTWERGNRKGDPSRLSLPSAVSPTRPPLRTTSLHHLTNNSDNSLRDTVHHPSAPPSRVANETLVKKEEGLTELPPSEEVLLAHSRPHHLQLHRDEGAEREPITRSGPETEQTTSPTNAEISTVEGDADRPHPRGRREPAGERTGRLQAAKEAVERLSLLVPDTAGAARVVAPFIPDFSQADATWIVVQFLGTYDGSIFGERDPDHRREVVASALGDLIRKGRAWSRGLFFSFLAAADGVRSGKGPAGAWPSPKMAAAAHFLDPLQLPGTVAEVEGLSWAALAELLPIRDPLPAPPTTTPLRTELSDFFGELHAGALEQLRELRGWNVRVEREFLSRFVTGPCGELLLNQVSEPYHAAVVAEGVHQYMEPPDEGEPPAKWHGARFAACLRTAGIAAVKTIRVAAEAEAEGNPIEADGGARALQGGGVILPESLSDLDAAS